MPLPSALPAPSTLGKRAPTRPGWCTGWSRRDLLWDVRHLVGGGGPRARDGRPGGGLAQAGGDLHGLVDLGVAGAAAKVPGERFLDLLPRRPRALVEERARREHHARLAEPALERAAIGEGALQGIE